MATALSAALANALKVQRTGVGVSPSAVAYSGTVSELAVGDFVWGPRALVVATGTTSGSGATQVRNLTLERMGVQFQVNWLPTQTVIFYR